jgi:hypothetical protein
MYSLVLMQNTDLSTAYIIPVYGVLVYKAGITNMAAEKLRLCLTKKICRQIKYLSQAFFRKSEQY